MALGFLISYEIQMGCTLKESHAVISFACRASTLRATGGLTYPDKSCENKRTNEWTDLC